MIMPVADVAPRCAPRLSRRERSSRRRQPRPGEGLRCRPIRRRRIRVFCRKTVTPHPEAPSGASRPLPPGEAGEPHDRACRHLAHRQRRAGRGAGPAAHASRRFPARGAWADRHAHRLRAGRLRRLHGPARRRDRARLPRPRRAGARSRGRGPSRASPTPARSPTCRACSRSATRCSAASARRAC